MKNSTHIALIVALLIGMNILPSQAQVSENEVGLVYYLPKTEIVVDVEYEEVTLKKGPFYQYSERYLATKEMVQEDGVRYVLKSVTLHSHTIADKSRAYSLVPMSGQKVVLTKKGLLCGIGVDQPTEKKARVEESKSRQESIISNDFAGLLEEQMLASSISKMAEGTAKQIYHIREARMNWLCGEVDNMPADGQSLTTILKELDKQEKRLTALFLGTERRKTMHKYITLEPKDMKDQVVVRFSELSGPVEADDLSGEPIYLTATCTRQQYTEEVKKSATPSQLYYNLPGSIYMELSDGETILQSKTFQIGQFGISVALPATTLKRAKVIRLDCQSGALLSVE